MDQPTEKQLAVIRRLSKGGIDVAGITSKKEASKLIEDLLARKNGGNGNTKDCHEKKVAFGLAVKLVFQKSIQLNLDYRADEFWKEVEEFYQQYLKQQNRVLKLGSQG